MLAITGRSGSGKTYLAKHLIRRLAVLAPVIVSMDSYYLDLSGMAPAERDAVDFDRPEALDWDLLAADVARLKEGQAIDQPVYDFASHTRATETIHISPRDLIIVEGLFALDERLMELFDLTVFVDTPEETALERRLMRDIGERGRVRDAVLRQYENHVRPAYRKYISPVRHRADLLLNGLQPVEECAAPVIARLKADQGLTMPGRQDVMEELYQRYAKAGMSRNFRFVYKKYVWKGVVGGAKLLKRLIDIVGSAAGFLILWPVLAGVALAIKGTDRGPVFFWQTRVGLYGREFPFPKFRSMVVNAEALKDELLEQSDHGSESVTFKMKKDPRVTWIGRIIRKLSIDELPQLWCVLIGQMSLVGPRPPVPREVAEYTLSDRRRLEVIPGLTGLWQVSGRGDIAFPEQVQLDVEYINSQSIWFDIKLLLKTVPAVLLGKGAY